MSVESAMRWVQENGRVGRGKRYPEGLSAALASYARERRVQGATWLDLEYETGIGWMQLRRWSESAPPVTALLPTSGMRPVRVEVQGTTVTEPPAVSSIRVRLPGDVLVEGLSFGEVVRLIREWTV
jgi:hypothetical protein